MIDSVVGLVLDLVIGTVRLAVGFLADWVLGLVALALTLTLLAAYLLLSLGLPLGALFAAMTWVTAVPDRQWLAVPVTVAWFVGWAVWFRRVNNAFFLERGDGP